MRTVATVSARAEELLTALDSGGFGPAAPAAAELVSLVVGLYGDGLRRILALLAELGPGGAAMTQRLAADELVEGLLLLHGLHPLPADARIERALARIAPQLGSAAVRYLGTDDGVARLALTPGGGCGCGAAAGARLVVDAVRDAAPELTDVLVQEAAREPALLQIGRRPAGQAAP